MGYTTIVSALPPVLTDIYDTPPVANAEPTVQSFEHHTHLTYVPETSLFGLLNTSPVWSARPAVLLTGVDVTSQTFAAGTPREQIRRYVLNYGSVIGASHYVQLQSVHVDGRCTSGDPTEDPTTFLLPAEPATPVCGAMPVTTFTYSQSVVAPTPTKMPNMPTAAGAAPFPAYSNPVLLDVNSDGLLDYTSQPATAGGAQNAVVNAVTGHAGQTPTNTWTTQTLTMNHPVLGAQTNLMAPWGGGGAVEYSPGAFLNDAHLNVLWLDPAWFTDAPTSRPLTTGVAYGIYSPTASSSTTWDWGNPVTGTIPSVFVGLLNTCAPGCVGGLFRGGPCATGQAYVGVDQKYATLDVDGDGLQDMIVTSDYQTNTPPGPDLEEKWKVSVSTLLNVKFTQRAMSGVVSPFAAPLPQETQSVKLANGEICGVATTSPASFNDAPNFCVGGANTSDQLFDQTNPATFGDINGDGIPDWVKRYADHLQVWFGHGDGVFGGCATPDNIYNATSVSCACAQATYSMRIPTTWSALNAQNSALNAQFHDLDGDGYDDAMVPSVDGFDVYINGGGGSFSTHYHVNAETGFGWSNVNGPNNVGFFSVYLFGDMNASGVDDVVIANSGGGIGYIDVLGGERVGLLETISTLPTMTSAPEATTTIFYESLPALSTAAATAGQPWLHQSPQSLHVVKSVITWVQDVSTQPAVETDYTYTDPIFDGRDREFVGFTTVTATTLGDNDAPTSSVKTSYYNGYCDYKPSSDSPNVCPVTADYLNHALRGLPILTETTGGNRGFEYLSTIHRGYIETPVYFGMDGRTVRRLFNKQTDSYFYDQTLYTSPPATTEPLADIYLETGGTQTQFPFFVGPASTVHTKTVFTLDDLWGVSNTSYDYGKVDATGASIDGIEENKLVVTPIPADSTDFWIYRSASVLQQGVNASLAAIGTPRTAAYSYDSRGNVLTITSQLSGVVQMVRGVSGPPGSPTPPSGNPSNASVNGTVTLIKLTPDPKGTGNVVRSEQPGTSGCTDIGYDGPFSRLVTSRTQYLQGCGKNALVSSASSYVRGLDLPTDTETPDAQATHVDYDPFGRVHAVRLPDPTTPGLVQQSASVTYAYADTTFPRTVQRTPTVGPQSIEAFDGAGRPMYTLAQADISAGDVMPWILSGQVLRNAKGLVSSSYTPTWTSSPSTIPAVGGPVHTYQYDPFDRLVRATDLDGTVTLKRGYGQPLGYADEDAAQVGSTGGSLGTVVQRDGHGRVQKVIRTGNKGFQTDQYTYLPTGELWVLDRTGTDATGANYAYERWLQYDSLGRVVLNAEPGSTTGFVVVGPPAAGALPTSPPSSLKAWTYAYDDAGRLVATTDARGCGENIQYDGGGRTLSEDYFGCTPTQLPYSAPSATGAGAEVVYDYAPSAGSTGGVSSGRLTDVFDRAAHTQYAYDGRGRVTSVGRNMVQPGAVPTPVSGYAPHQFVAQFGYDDSDRLVIQTTGEDASQHDLNGTSFSSASVTSTSAVGLTYSKRGVLSSVGGSYGPLIRQKVVDADGLPLSISWGDSAAAPSDSNYKSVPGTQTNITYDARRRIYEWKTSRSAPGLWSTPSGSYTPPSSSPVTTTQTVLQDDLYSDDLVGNPTAITDKRVATEWPPAYQPVSRSPITYDDFYRLTSMTYVYAGGANTAAAPDASTTSLPLQTTSTRVGKETFDYDPLGNPRGSTDDQGLFFDRSLGAVVTGTTASGSAGGAVSSTDQVVSASLTTAAGDGYLTASYDAAGDLEQLAVVRPGPCASADGCSQLFHYDWDELGQLAHAQRFDFLPQPPCTGRVCSQLHLPKYDDPTNFTYPDVPPFAAGAEETFTYARDGSRALRASLSTDGSPTTYTAEIFSSLRLNDTTFGEQSAGDYDRSDATDGVYLIAGGSSLGRVVYQPADPIPTTGLLAGQHVFLEITDPLGSTSTVIDKATSELVERTTYSAYGRVESDYRPDRWQDFSEPYKFTGKEGDAALGLTYFGARYYSPFLGTWMSADPLTVHAIASDLNPYAYVSGRTLRATDPLGLTGKEEEYTGQSDEQLSAEANAAAASGDYDKAGALLGQLFRANQLLGAITAEVLMHPAGPDPANSGDDNILDWASEWAGLKPFATGLGIGIMSSLNPTVAMSSGGLAAGLPGQLSAGVGVGLILGGMAQMFVGAAGDAGAAGGTAATGGTAAPAAFALGVVSTELVTTGATAATTGVMSLMVQAGRGGWAGGGGGGSGASTGRNAQGGINANARGLQHATDRHTVGGSQNVNASTFSQGENLQDLVRAAEGQPAMPQQRGNFQTIVMRAVLSGLTELRTRRPRRTPSLRALVGTWSLSFPGFRKEKGSQWALQFS